MAVTDLHALVRALTETSQAVPLLKSAVTTYGAGALHSLWAVAGEPGTGTVASAVNGSGVSATTVGAAPLTNAAAGNQLALARLSLAATAGVYWLYDRGWHNATLVGNSTGSQAVSGSFTELLARYPNGVGVRAWVEWYATTGTGTPTLTMTYTNSDGTGRTTTVVWPDSPVSGQLLRIPLAAGDRGIRVVTACQLSSATSVAGNWGITLGVPLVEVPVVSGGVDRDAIALGLPVIPNNAALAWAFLATTANHAALHGSLTVVEG